MARWAVIDSLYCAEQFFCSHLDSYSHYLNEAGEDAQAVCLNIPPPGYDSRDDCWHPEWRFLHGGPGLYKAPPGRVGDHNLDVAFFLDGYGRAPEVPAKKRIAQVAAVCSPMPWEVRNADGAPVFDLVLSSIPAMVEEARAAGCRAEYQQLCFDTRALTCSMGVAKDIGCLFVGTVDGNHRKRAEVLARLEGLVTIAPPTFGRDYYKLISRAKTAINVHAEWARGARNALRIYETFGFGGLCVTDGQTDGVPGWELESDARGCVVDAIHDFDEGFAEEAQGELLTRDTYVQRVPELIAMVRAL